VVHTREGQPEASPARTRLRLAVAAVFGLAPLVVVPGLFDFANLPQSSFLEVSAAALLTAAVATPVWRLRARRLEWPPLAAPLLLWLAWSALSCAWSPNPALALRVWWPWLAAATGYLLLFHLADGADDLRPVAAAALAAGAVVAALGIGQAMWGWTFVPQAFPPSATFANKNIAAQFAVGVLPFGLVWMARPGGGRSAGGAVAALLLVFVALTRTRAAAVALLVEMIVLAAWWGRGRRWLWALAGLTAAALALAITLQVRAASAGSVSALSVQGRLAIWRNTLVMIREHPVIGVGLGSHAWIYPAYHRRAVVDPLFSSRVQLDFAHDDYLQLAAELGLAGAALLAILGVTFVRLVRHAHARTRAGADGIIAASATAAAAGLLAEALFSFSAYRALPPWLLALDAAMLAVLARGPAAARGFLIAAGGARQAVAGVAALACAVSAVTCSRWLRGDAHVEAARRAESRGDAPRMAAEAEAAVAFDAARGDAWFLLGTADLVRGDAEGAARALREAVARQPFNPNALANLGTVRAKAGDRAGATDALRRSLAINPGEADVAYQLGLLLQEAGDGGGAIEAFRQSAAARPSDPRAQYRRGLLALRARRLAEAEEALRAAVALDPGGAGAHKALGVVLLEGGRRDEAVTHFREALRLDASIADRAMMERVIAGSAPASGP
jgi:tetratricopeptide (TPR) repeat protein